VVRLLPHISLVERQLIALKDVPINAATLTRSRADNSIQPTRLELSLQRRLNLATRLQSLLSLGLHALARLGRCLRSSLTGLLSPTSNVRAVVRLVPSPEWCSVDLNDSGAGEGVCANEFVVGRVVCYDDDSDLASDALAAPGEVASFETQGAVFSIAATGADEMNALGSDTGVGWLTTFLEGSLLAVVCALCTGGRPLVAAVS